MGRIAKPRRVEGVYTATPGVRYKLVVTNYGKHSISGQWMPISKCPVEPPSHAFRSHAIHYACTENNDPWKKLPFVPENLRKDLLKKLTADGMQVNFDDDTVDEPREIDEDGW